MLELGAIAQTPNATTNTSSAFRGLAAQTGENLAAPGANKRRHASARKLHPFSCLGRRALCSVFV